MSNHNIPLPTYSVEELSEIDATVRIAENLGKLMQSADKGDKLFDIHKTIDRIGSGLERVEKLLPKIEPLKSRATDSLNDIRDTIEDICDGLRQIEDAGLDDVQEQVRDILQGIEEVEERKEAVNE
jgi:hypothetical protein